MAVLFVDRPIDSLIFKLQKDRDVLERTYMNKQDEQSFNALAAISDKIRCAEMYQRMLNKRGEFDKFKHLKWKNPTEYIKRCKSLIKHIKGISFSGRDGFFIVRVQRNKVRQYLGSFETPQDAIEALDTYLNLK